MGVSFQIAEGDLKAINQSLNCKRDILKGHVSVNYYYLVRLETPFGSCTPHLESSSPLCFIRPPTNRFTKKLNLFWFKIALSYQLSDNLYCRIDNSISCIYGFKYFFSIFDCLIFTSNIFCLILSYSTLKKYFDLCTVNVY